MLVIIHGWSDTGRSFAHLGRRLVEEGVAPGVRHVRLGEYISLDDDVTFDDLAAALQKAWQDEALPTRKRSVDVIVHSTGALVARHWMTRYFRPETNPIHRLLMLAPANFGSPLAHKGRSFIGRVVKGFKSDKPFQTGTHILRGLELASPFAWDLAMRDRFGGQRWYGPGRVLATALVGTAGYGGISAAANEPGGDGTVRVATANLNAGLVSFDFATDPQKPKLAFAEPEGATAFARIDDENHSTIAFKDGGPRSDLTLPFIRRALEATDAGFDAFCMELELQNQASRSAGEGDEFTHAYQDTVVRVTDDHGESVRDYFVEVFAKSEDEARVDDRLTSRIQEDVVSTVHANDENPAYRSLLLDTTELMRIVAEGNRPIFVSLTAMPDLRVTKSVGYSTIGYDDVGSIRLTPARLAKFIQPDRTVLVDLRIHRYQEDAVFRFSGL